MSLDLMKFGYSQEVADSMSARMIEKVIVSSRFKGKKKHRPDLDLVISVMDKELGSDWYDYAFMDRVGDNITIIFYRVVAGTKRNARVCFNLSCILTRNFDAVISNCRIVKEMNDWTIISRPEVH